MAQFLQRDVTICGYHLEGIYLYTVEDLVGNHQSNVPVEIICTVQNGKVAQDDLFDDSPQKGNPERDAIFGPITLQGEGICATIRPWDPSRCSIAAGIYNGVVQIPIRPGSCVFLVGYSLRTLSHVADITGTNGSVFGIVTEDANHRPSRANYCRFFSRYPSSFVATTDMDTAIRGDYERLFSLPASSRWAFLMGLHPRVGAASPVRLLLRAPKPPVLLRRIFAFARCSVPARTASLAFGLRPPNFLPEMICDVLLRHVDAIQSWWSLSGVASPTEAVAAEAAPAKANFAGEGRDLGACATGRGGAPWSDNISQTDPSLRDTDTDDERGGACPRDASEGVLEWVLAGLPLARLEGGNGMIGGLLKEVAAPMQRRQCGCRTGLKVNARLPLAPYFEDYALFLLKYSSRRKQSCACCVAADGTQIPMQYFKTLAAQVMEDLSWKPETEKLETEKAEAVEPEAREPETNEPETAEEPETRKPESVGECEAVAPPNQAAAVLPIIPAPGASSAPAALPETVSSSVQQWPMQGSEEVTVPALGADPDYAAGPAPNTSAGSGLAAAPPVTGLVEALLPSSGCSNAWAMHARRKASLHAMLSPVGPVTASMGLEQQLLLQQQRQHHLAATAGINPQKLPPLCSPLGGQGNMMMGSPFATGPLPDWRQPRHPWEIAPRPGTMPATVDALFGVQVQQGMMAAATYGVPPTACGGYDAASLRWGDDAHNRTYMHSLHGGQAYQTSLEQHQDMHLGLGAPAGLHMVPMIPAVRGQEDQRIMIRMAPRLALPWAR